LVYLCEKLFDLIGFGLRINQVLGLQKLGLSFVVLDNVVDLLVVNKFEYCLFGEAILARLVAE